MIRLIMAFSLIGTVGLIGICAPLSKTVKTPISQNNVSIMQFDTEKGIDETEDFDMQDSAVKDMFRGEIVGKSIQILRSHGKSDEEIREMMSKDFSISEKELNSLLQTEKE